MTEASGRPVVFGEVLFDQFEDGASVLGGAPFNVAWHLQGFGLRPLFISRIGQDTLGEQVLEAMFHWGMDSAGVTIDPTHPTGTVRVALVAGQPTFDIVPEQAYDFISANLASKAVRGIQVSLLYYGTLVARHSTSRDSLLRVRREAGMPAFVDINLRAPWWDQDTVTAALAGARWAKLNDAELAAVLQHPPLALEEIEPAARDLLRRYGLKLVVVTLGERGACMVTASDARFGLPEQVDDLVDTVGAGDAFAAATILGLSRGWPSDVILARALGFAAEICRRRGATHRDRGWYSDCLAKWHA